ncbi:MAG TPA: zf-HC2 domain-containing protein [Polyangiales bacterium]|nr:zf-HC2 domain-containing protein [Polyangiales bacterium]
MSVEHVSDELLQRHFDGELEPAEQAQVREHLPGCTDCNARLRSLERMQQLIRMAAGDAATEADWQGMFARIEQAVQQPEVVVRKPTALTGRTRWFRGATMSAVGAFAVAAAALLMVYRQDDAVSLQDDGDGESLEALERSEITHVDFGGNAGTVFDIAFADGSSTPVVWINDDDDDDDEAEEF